MKRDQSRRLPPVMEMMTHDQGMKDCAVMTDCAVHTIVMADGRAYAAMVFNQRECPVGATAVLNRAEAEAQIALLMNALDDADRINSGNPPLARENPGSLQ
ncbi:MULTISPECIES: hypothetical protein [Sphingomonas]|uniref:hypothetical protein n=1 Tax=Sphingomonas TaxID=13687 RepID=UPI00082A6603|nr:hypothetical protein [Sphingomonas sp. CCH10-B3]